MQAIRSVKNQYRGVNTYLHSLLLKEGGWSEVQNSYIQDLFRTMRNELLPLGYTVGLEHRCRYVVLMEVNNSGSLMSQFSTLTPSDNGLNLLQ